MPATPIGGFFAASAMWKPRRVKWKHQKAREPGPGLIPPRGGHGAPESPGTWPWVEPSSGLTPRGGHGAAEPQPLVVPPFMLVQGPLSVLCPKRNCPDHKPKAAGNSKTVLGPANCSGEKEPQEYLPDSAPGSLADWLRAAAPKPFTTRDHFHGRQRLHEWRVDDFGMIRAHYIYCVLCFYYCYISSTSDHPRH